MWRCWLKLRYAKALTERNLNKPLLLIDVDGVISLFGFDPGSPPPGHWEMVDGIAHFLSDGAGPLLRRLVHRYELAWCTGWEEKANEYLPLALELPGPLPYLTFERGVSRGTAPAAEGTVAGHWKLHAIEDFAGHDRPVAWIDDGFDDACRRWAEGRPGPTLLIATDPAVGFTEGQAEELEDWARTGAAGGPR